MPTPALAITIRQFQPRDLPRLMVLEQDAFPSEAWPKQLFELYANQYPDLFLIAKAGNRIAGYCIGRMRTAKAAEIDSIAVFPRYQRRGIARKLLRRLLRQFAAKGASEVGLMVRPENKPAVEFYRELGFVWRRTIAGYYGGNARGWRLTRSLESRAR